MSEAISKLASVMQRDVETLKSIANNAANSTTNGYRAERSYLTNASASVGLANGDVSRQFTATDGAKVATARPLDLALDGPAWFVVQTPAGVRYTRDGQFTVSSSGVITTLAGDPLLSTSGEIHVEGPGIKVNQNGEVLTASGAHYQLHLPNVKIEKLLGNNLYSGTELGIAEHVRVHQGALERSNVDIGQEMIRMMETTRHFESMQRAVSAYDQMLNIGINELGK